jgi:hypothetical protein
MGIFILIKKGAMIIINNKKAKYIAELMKNLSKSVMIKEKIKITLNIINKRFLL